MGAIGGMLGLAGGVNGTGVQGPRSADVVNPTNTGQIGQAYTGAQNSMQSQQGLLQALQGQNGLGNQSQVYNQLQGVANGTGPNPAQAMLAQATGANSANQAALMAGQRGAGSNVGLMARQAGQQGAANQQAAAGQAATMQANQSLNAIGQAGQMANTQAGQQIGQTNANTQAQQAEQAQLINAQLGVNNANVGMQSNINQANASAANAMSNNQSGAIGGLASGAAGALGIALAGGGSVPSYADGGDVGGFSGGSKFGAFLNSGVNPGAANVSQIDMSGGQPNQGQQQDLKKGMSNLGSALGSIGSTPSTPMAPSLSNIQATPAMASKAGYSQPMMANGGGVPVLLSPGEKKLSPEQAQMVAKGKANPMAMGETVPGKAPVGGAKNSYKNDIVADKAEPGTIIVPRSHTQSDDPVRDSVKFVRDTLAKRKVKK